MLNGIHIKWQAHGFRVAQGVAVEGEALMYFSRGRKTKVCKGSTHFQGGKAFQSGKDLQNLSHHVFWPRMQQDVARFVRGCVLCSTSKPANRKTRLYMPFLVLSRPWKSISMDFLGGLPTTRRGHDY